MSTKQWNFSCQRRRAGAGCRRGPRPGLGQDAGGKITGQAAVPATKSHGQVAGSERPGTRRDAGEDRGWGQDKMPAGAEAWAGTRCRRENHRAGSGLGAARDQTGCRRGPRLSRQGANQLKRKRSIISSSNPGFSKSFSLVMIKLLCSKNPASW